MLVFTRVTAKLGTVSKTGNDILCEENAKAFTVLELEDGSTIEVCHLKNEGSRTKVGVNASQKVRVFRGEFFLLRKAEIDAISEATRKPRPECTLAFDKAYEQIEEKDTALKVQLARQMAIQSLNNPS